MEKKQFAAEAKEHLLNVILPFWMNLKDDENGGYVGWVDYDLKRDEKAFKGCILNSRITWFFSSVYKLCVDGLITDEELKAAGLSREAILENAKHGYSFLMNKCIDRENGGIFWSLTYDGKPFDTTKHCYNQAFCIYALSAYYEISGDKAALDQAYELMNLIETKCRDDVGYLEAFTIDFKPESNEKLSENGVEAKKTMNTLLHVFEAYTALYRVTKDDKVKARLQWMMDLIATKIYNPTLHRQEVFFDENYNSIIDLHSYGHDIETAWLVDLGVDTIDDSEYKKKMDPITQDLTKKIFERAWTGKSLHNECERGVDNTHRIWWVQAETVVGFLNGYMKTPEHTEYYDAAVAEWEFIKEFVWDKRPGSEWFWEVREDGTPFENRPIVEQWKCPYHNGRMTLELIKRLSD